jgi:hypothetical protein
LLVNAGVKAVVRRLAARAAGLGACTALTRLNLSDNRLTRIEGLAGLHRLRRAQNAGQHLRSSLEHCAPC